MKRNDLIVGICYLLVGILCLLVTLFTETPLESLFAGFAGGGIVPGLFMIYKYFYWSHPAHRDAYAEKMARERIELHDELKEKVRGKTAQYLYLLGLVVISLSIVVFTVLGLLGWLENAKVFVAFLFAFLILQVLSGRWIFSRLMKRY